MKEGKKEHTFQFPWEIVTAAFWRKYRGFHNTIPFKKTLFFYYYYCIVEQSHSSIQNSVLLVVPSLANPITSHVQSVDILSRSVDHGRLQTQRLIMCSQNIPYWLKPFIGQSMKKKVKWNLWVFLCKKKIFIFLFYYYDYFIQNY